MRKLATEQSKKFWFTSFLLTATVFLGFLFIRLQRRKKALSARRFQEERDLAPPQLNGLSEAEAAERLVPMDLDALHEQERKDFMRQAIRQNLLTTFNIDLFIIAIIMLLLDSPWSTLGTLVVLALNVSINVFQEMFTKNKLDQLLNEIRPQSTVIRDKVIRSINPAQVVRGDLLVIRRGDQILLNGELVGTGEITVEERVADEPPRRIIKRAGDLVYAGSFCVEGRALSLAGEAGNKMYKEPPGVKLQLLYSEMTPLERMMETILRLLFVLAIIFSIILVADALVANVKLISSQFRNAISLIFAIAPTSLFFILILQYATGTLRLSRNGALVFKSTTIEKLSNVSVLCLSKSSLVAGMQVILEPIPPPPGHEIPSENLIRQFIGDISHSLPVTTQTESLIAEAMPGTPRKILEYAQDSETRGWLAVTFDETDLRGTFVIGDPVVIKPNLDLGGPEIVQDLKRTVTQARHGLGHWLDRFKQQDTDEDSSESSDTQPTNASDQPVNNPVESDLEVLSPEPPTAGEQPRTSWRVRLITGLDRLLTPIEEREASQTIPDQMSDQPQILFAYLPEPVPLSDQLGRPKLPKALIPLANLRVSDVIRPEAQETIHKLTDLGMDIKIMSSEATERLLLTSRQLGMDINEDSTKSGSYLEGMDTEELWRSIKGNSVFGDVSPSQQAQIIQVFKDKGEYVAMVGNDPGDVPAMQQANLKLATKSGSQVALAQTDIVLLKDSLEALPSVLTTGQRLVNSVLDTFKLYLSQVLAQVILILFVLVLNRGIFPYTSSQGGLVNAFTIAIPNIFLSAWSAAGKLTGAEMRQRLVRFIIPIGVTLPLLSFGVLAIFLNRTPPPEFNTMVSILFTVDDVGLFYAQLAVTYALLIAGWLRLLFLQPPSKLWVGGAALRGDRRVISLVSITIIFFILFFSFPIFQELLEMPWLPFLSDYLLVTLCTFIWALTVSVIWRLGLVEKIAAQFERAPWIRGKNVADLEDFSDGSVIESN